MPKIKKAFILGAGFGKRLKPITDTIPKPMVTVKNRPLIDHTLDKFIDHGVEEVIVNTHYLREVLKSHLSQRTDIQIHISPENDVLETGGGIILALERFPDFRNTPFFVLSGDMIWEDPKNEPTILQRLEDHWDDSIMDILIALQDINIMEANNGIGDYDVKNQPFGLTKRSIPKKGQYMFANIRINHPRIFENESLRKFSFLELLDQAEQNQKLYGLVHKGSWHHISTPNDLKMVRNHFTRGS